MIEFFTETQFEFSGEDQIREWMLQVISSEKKEAGDLNFIFCDDEYLLEINRKYLNHDTYTDIISFDNSVGRILSGDVFISVERVRENAIDYKTEFDDELRRVLVHGLLHFCGYKDKTDFQVKLMREKEDEKLKMFHVEQ